MKKIISLILLSLFVFSKGVSQNLVIDSLAAKLAIPDTVNYNDNLNHTIIVNITGGAAYTGSVYLVAAVDSSNGNQSIDTVAIRNVVNKLNDTIVFGYNESYDNPNGYRVGGNVVVIWPIAITLNTLDSFAKVVYVNALVGINDNEELYNAFSVYPNPTQNYIHIKKDPGIEVKRVRIVGANGQLVYNEKLKSQIDISELSKGIYFLEIELKGREILHYKLIKN